MRMGYLLRTWFIAQISAARKSGSPSVLTILAINNFRQDKSTLDIGEGGMGFVLIIQRIDSHELRQPDAVNSRPAFRAFVICDLIFQYKKSSA